jgi:hypothetical protein
MVKVPSWPRLLETIESTTLIGSTLVQPLLRGTHVCEGLPEVLATRAYPGDELVAEPRSSWTHGIEIAASTDDVWPWLSLLGATRGGFYSYPWLERIAGCRVQRGHARPRAWAVTRGDPWLLHPKIAALRVAGVKSGLWFVAYGSPDIAARTVDRPWLELSWLFHLEALAARRCRLVSRCRVNSSDDLTTKLALGPLLLEPFAGALNRRLLHGVRKRAQAGAHTRSVNVSGLIARVAARV